MSDPFQDDHNPFADVEEYNPFTGGAPGGSLRVNEPQPTSIYSTPTYSSPPSSSYGDSSVIRLDDDSDDEAPGFFGGKEDNPYTFDSSAPSSTSRGQVTIQTNEAPNGTEYSIWQIEFYQQFFNVDSSEVGWRCLRSMWPFKADFINFVSINPDFYGPLWITTTLIFMFAASSNFADYLYSEPGQWQYDFLKLTVGTGIIYGFTFAVPFFFWLYFKWADLNISLIEMLCIYGYSLFIYCPVSVVCVAPFNAVQWTAIAVGCLISTLFLIVNMWHPLKSKLAHAIPLMVVMALLHVAVGVTFMLYYFHFHSSPTPTPTPTPGPQPVPVTPTPIPIPTPSPSLI
eukprot:TRINITY_DN497_c0_g1_i1.p1 TRINITY_DN497_c0_g1~~TRINITY_DN497_c0_g1_i1.p1  ORF type:complete len:342 (+),score=57.10 TRINITY_DN497_c0_g1_i1:40-1065(+)